MFLGRMMSKLLRSKVIHVRVRNFGFNAIGVVRIGVRRGWKDSGEEEVVESCVYRLMWKVPS